MNQTDPLAQLNDIHLPEPLMLWVPAIGWWFLAILIFVVSYWALTKTFKIIAHRRYRKLALQELSALTPSENSTELLTALNYLLKRTAITAFSRETCGALKGSQWLAFLDSTMPTKADTFTEGSGKALAEGQYQAHCDYNADALLALSQRWIKTHTKSLLKKERGNV